MTAAMKIISRSNRSLQTPSPPVTPVSLHTPSPPVTPTSVSRLSFPKMLYLYNPTPKNINAWAKLNPDFEIQVCSPTEMEQFLLGELGEIYHNIFRHITDKEIQSTFLGVCLLYVYGCIYSDTGNVPIVSLDSFIESDVDFITCNSYLNNMNSHRNNIKINFKPSFIESHKDNSILKNCLEWYIQRYETNTPYSYVDWNMMRAFTDILSVTNYSSSDGVYHANTMKIQILK